MLAEFQQAVIPSCAWNWGMLVYLRGCTSGGVYVPCIYMHARWELLLVTRVFVVCARVTSLERYLTPLCVDSARALQAPFCFRFLYCPVKLAFLNLSCVWILFYNAGRFFVDFFVCLCTLMCVSALVCVCVCARMRLCYLRFHCHIDTVFYTVSVNYTIPKWRKLENWQLYSSEG